jgi:hypothetical protein
MRNRYGRLAVVVISLLAGVAGGLFVPSAAAVSGEMRVLYVLATWGPTPFTQAEVEQVAAETDRFFQESSDGRLSMPGSVIGPIVLPRAAFDTCDATALRSEMLQSAFVGYDRAAIITPPVASCPFGGEANPTEVLLNGLLFTALAVHELGHTLELGHASAWLCGGGSCTVDEYGSDFSVMGGGYGDFNAYEKSQLEWLTGVLRPTGAAGYEIGPIEGPTTLPQAFVVTTASSEFWFESRGRSTPAFVGPSVQPAGVAVTAGPFIGSQTTSPYPRPNLLLPNPVGGRAGFSYSAGETFVQPGIFAVAVERHSSESAVLRLEWRDRVAPSKPPLRVRVKRRGRVQLDWEPARERGSGVATYTVLADGRPQRVLDGEIPYLNVTATLRLPRGTHRVGVFATDRAGNRGPATLVRVRVRVTS